jgi:cellobiose transport system permease protein
MQAVPRELYEAAVVDGASRLRQFFSVTIPSIRPTMIFVILTMTIGGLQVFDEVVMFDPTGSGGSNRQFETMGLYLFNVADFGTWMSPNLGRGAAIAWLFAAIILTFAIINFFITRAISSDGKKGPKAKNVSYRRAIQERRSVYSDELTRRDALGDWDPSALNVPAGVLSQAALAGPVGSSSGHLTDPATGQDLGIEPGDEVNNY